MEIKVASGNILEMKADALLLSIYEGAEKPEGALARLDGALDGAVSALMKQGEIKGKSGEVTVIHTLGKLPAARLVIIGLGKPGELARDKICGAVADALRLLRQKRVATVASAVHGAGTAGITPEVAAQAITEAALLGLYTFRRHITKKPEFGEVKKLSLVGAQGEMAGLKRGVEKGRIVSEAATLARDMVNEPANYMTPTIMAAEARKLAEKYGLEVSVLDEGEMRKLGMGALLGVAQGSCQPPKMIILRYRGNGTADTGLALIGKGITFDSGGISIKPSEKMEEMKGDMAGGAAVISTMVAIAQLKPKINVLGVIPATENLPSGSAQKPGDVVTALGGKTIEVINTDAEGRLILADALGYAVKLGARRLVDIATLTGACVVALGNICTGAFTNNQALLDRVLAAAKESGELTWQLPMFEQYKELNKSDVADIKNSGGRWGGAITAAQFLAEFVGDTPWVHLDIAGTSDTDKERGCLVKGATGVPVRTLVNLVLALAKEVKK